MAETAGQTHGPAASSSRPRRTLLLAVFITIALSIVGAAHAYFALRLVMAPHWPEPFARIGNLAILAGALSLIAAPIAERTLPPRAARFVAWPAALWMGACFYWLLGLWLSDAVLGLAGLSGIEVARGRAVGLGLLTLALMAFGLRSGLRGPQTNPVHITLRRWPKLLDGYRVVQLSDVHIGALLRREFAARVVAQVHAQKPDLVVVTGDLVDGSVQHLAAEVLPFGSLRARHGVFFVTGNHDYFSGAERWTRKVRELGMTPLRNTHVTITDAASAASFELAGVDDPTGKRMGGSGDDVSAALRGIAADRPVILLAHDPKTFDKAARAGVDLQLSGHTHGGQLWPFNYFVRLATRFVAGLYRVGEAQIYVSCGTGFWGPPMRVAAPAEVTVIVLHSAPD